MFIVHSIDCFRSCHCFIHVLIRSVGIAVSHEFPPARCPCQMDPEAGDASTAVRGMWCTSGRRRTTPNILGGIVTPASTGLKRTKSTGGSMPSCAWPIDQGVTRSLSWSHVRRLDTQLLTSCGNRLGRTHPSFECSNLLALNVGVLRLLGRVYCI